MSSVTSTLAITLALVWLPLGLPAEARGSAHVELPIARVVAGSEASDYATIRKDQPRQSFWNTAAFTVGPDSSRRDAGARSFWQFDVSRFARKRVLNAELMTVETSSGSCRERPVDIWRTSRVRRNTTWRSQPEWRAKVATRTSAQGFSSECPMGALSFDVTHAVRFSANRSRDGLTLGVRAGDESDPKSWKRFNRGAYLSVEYVTPPSPPSQLRFQDPVADCGSMDAPSPLGQTTARLAMLLKSPDGGNAQLGAQVALWAADQPDTSIWSNSTEAFYPSGAIAQFGIPDGVLSDGSTYFVRARTHYLIEPDRTLPSEWTAPCWFTVDLTAPNAPVVTTVDFPECSDTDTCQVGPPTGSFTFANGGSNDVVSYRYRLDGKYHEVMPDVPGDSVIVNVTETSGFHQLEVWSQDAAGHVGNSTNYTFLTGNA